ncbi:outer membrane lipoprotein carrier protein LolA [Acetobacter sacchari]|uniref:Outer membrane lipoprotein carrier protein LolA n=1 Tax=Acetobacter sacchari TaxID=2661687 RepID=A0ABS3LVD4_9PROT|nr:outer membrane lipoprotein carrier protein LolA [Acetobacter sacchari]
MRRRIFTRRSLFLLAGLAMSPAALAPARAEVTLTPADKGWVGRIQETLNQITTLRARFEQIAPDGQRTTGVVWLSRPGRMRFAYDKPSPLLLVANDGKVVFRDEQLDQTTEIPIDRTPLGLLLGAHIVLSGDVTVTGFSHENGLLRLSVVRTATPGEGTLIMFFDEKPLALRSWIVVDAQGRQTQVSLSQIVPGVATPDALFALPHAE